MWTSSLLWPVLLAQNVLAITVDTTSAGKQLDLPCGVVGPGNTNQIMYDSLNKERRKHRSPRTNELLQRERHSMLDCSSIVVRSLELMSSREWYQVYYHSHISGGKLEGCS